MSTEQDQIRSLAERIAQRLSNNADERGAVRNDDLAALRDGLNEIRQRLAHIESHIKHDEDCERDAYGNNAPQSSSDRATQSSFTFSRPPMLSSTYVPAVHPSSERFSINDAVSELVDFFEREKVCTLEPGEKPCDKCGMCSSRGF